MTKAGASPVRRALVVGLLSVFWSLAAAPTSTAIASTGSVAPARVARAAAVGGLLEIQGDQFTVTGTHGYEITVVGYLGGRPSVTLYARRGHAEVEYTAPGTVSEEEMRARFGSLGSVDVHFEASGQIREAVNYCDSTHPTVAVRLGSFIGKIDFHGERGYTSVDTGRAAGGVGNDLALPGEPEDASCQSVAAEGEVVQTARFTSLEAAAPRSHVYFSAIATTEVEGASSPATSHVLLAAGSNVKEGKMEIRRLVAAEGPSSDFSFDGGLDSATVAPPSPFRGTARFDKDAGGSSSWTGSLKVPIPGLGTVDLAGAGFRTRFEQTTGTIIH
jgi:hypothetical protein